MKIYLLCKSLQKTRICTRNQMESQTRINQFLFISLQKPLILKQNQLLESAYKLKIWKIMTFFCISLRIIKYISNSATNPSTWKWIQIVYSTLERWIQTTQCDRIWNMIFNPIENIFRPTRFYCEYDFKFEIQYRLQRLLVHVDNRTKGIFLSSV